MGNSYPHSKLESLCEQVVDCPHSTPKWTNSGFVVIRSQNVRGGRLDFSSTSYTDEEHYKHRSRRIELRSDDLVITREAPMGEVCIIPAGLQCCLGQRMVALRVNKSLIDPRFLLYALQGKDVQHQIGFNEGTGSTVSNMRIPVLKALEIPVPDMRGQKAIAYILSVLDEKIITNEKTNQVLEDTAMAIFKSWFIDFDYVKAKIEGNSTILPPEVNKFFPSEFEESALGQIPKEWNHAVFGDLIEPKRGRVITKSVVKEGQVPVVAGGISPAYFHSEFNARAPVVTISASGTAGFVNIYYENIWASDCSYINKEVSEYVYFSYLFLRHHQDAIYHKRHGAVQQHIYPKDLMELPLAMPPIDLISNFEKLVTPYFEKVSLNLNENKLLKTSRDLLLQKLISGELQIPDPEKFLEEVLI